MGFVLCELQLGVAIISCDDSDSVLHFRMLRVVPVLYFQKRRL